MSEPVLCGACYDGEHRAHNPKEPCACPRCATVEVGHTLGFDVRFPETEEPATVGHDWLKQITVEFTAHDVDPAVLGILTGGALGTPPPASFAIEMWHPIKRTFWQWLRRKPRQWQRYYIPNARMAEQTGEEDE